MNTREKGNTGEGQKAMRESKLQKVQVCGEWEEWVVCEWVSTCVLDLDLGLDLACKMLARLACLGDNKGGGGGGHQHRGANAMGTHTP